MLVLRIELGNAATGPEVNMTLPVFRNTGNLIADQTLPCREMLKYWLVGGRVSGSKDAGGSGRDPKPTLSVGVNIFDDPCRAIDLRRDIFESAVSIADRAAGIKSEPEIP